MLFRTCVFALALLTIACSDAQTPEHAAAEISAELETLKTMESKVFPKGIEGGTDTTRGWPYVRAAQTFAETHPQNEAVPEVLMKAAGIANGTDWTNKSIQLWGYVWRRFPDHPRAPEAMFYQGFVMDTKFADYNLAKEYYNRFLTSYPDHELADEVKGLLKVANLGGKLPPVPSAPQN
ncbi:MAG: tol-pal system YbgF family protein [Saprospiraceae bacterium]